MQRAVISMVAIALAIIPLAPSSAQEATPAVHDELREFRQRLVQAVLADDVATQLEMAHPDIVTMWQDGRVAKGHDDLNQFLEALGKGSERGFLGYAQEPEPLDLAMVFDDRLAFSHGTSIARYNLYGMQFELPNYWTATLVKQDDQWKLVGYHVSANAADNPLLTAAKNSVYVIAPVAGVVGLLVGLTAGWMFGRRRSRHALDGPLASDA